MNAAMIVDANGRPVPQYFDSAQNIWVAISTNTPAPSSAASAANAELGALVTLTAASANGNTSDQTNVNAKGILLFVDATVMGGTTPTLTVILEAKDPNSGKYFALLTSTAIATVSSVLLSLYPGIAAAANQAVPQALPKTWRVRYTIGGTSPAITATIGASLVV